MCIICHDFRAWFIISSRELRGCYGDPERPQNLYMAVWTYFDRCRPMRSRKTSTFKALTVQDGRYALGRIFIPSRCMQHASQIVHISKVAGHSANLTISRKQRKTSLYHTLENRTDVFFSPELRPSDEFSRTQIASACPRNSRRTYVRCFQMRP
ncbi:hypothetical protein BC835DRAFT_725271 [Cytidiella melzeri]|nr:hypothetical protein BC835DRAFT_725271 [Cytidiella melzeri]